VAKGRSNVVTLEEIERQAILDTLRSTNWVVGGPKGAAAILGVKRTTLQALIQRLGISNVRYAVADARC
jgi:formate hydrogenlyase transcriptional activator